MKQTKCIHVPTLRWGKSARIVWADIETSEGYVLQRRLADEDGAFPDGFTTICDDGHFPVASDVYVWENINSAGVTWDMVAEYRLPWRKIDALCAGDQYSIHATHNTHNWEMIDASNADWSMVSGYQYSWSAIRSILGPTAHLGFDDQIPEEVSLAEYRLIIHYANGESEILSSGVLPVLGDDFEDVASRIVSAGDLAYYQINAKGMTALDKLLQITFNRDELELEDYYSGRLEPVSQEDGVIVFRLTRDISEDLEWAGLVVVLNFRALASCESQVSMETMDVK